MDGSGFSKTDRLGAFARVVRVLALRARLIGGTLLGNLRLTHALPADWRRRYAASRRDLRANDPVFLPSRQWTVISVFYRLVLRAWGLASFKSTFGRFLSTYEPGNPWLFQAVHHLYRGALEKRDAWGLLETLEEPELGDGTWVEHRGKRLSLDLLQSIDELYSLKEALGFEREDPVVFCELGAGYGRLAHVVLSAMPNATYLIFDLPESLLLSQHYLTSLRPDWAAVLYPDSEDVLRDPALLRQARLVFGLPHQLRLVPPGIVDAFVNVYSFMEMGREQIAAYFRIIEDLRAGVLYLKQHRREVNLFDKSLNTGDNYPVGSAWTRLFHRTSLLFEHVFEAAWRVSPRPAAARPASPTSR